MFVCKTSRCITVGKPIDIKLSQLDVTVSIFQFTRCLLEYCTIDLTLHSYCTVVDQISLFFLFFFWRRMETLPLKCDFSSRNGGSFYCTLSAWIKYVENVIRSTPVISFILSIIARLFIVNQTGFGFPSFIGGR